MAALTVVNGEDTKPFARVSRPPRPQEVELILQRSYPPSFPRITSTTTMPYSAEQYAPANTFPTYITANLVIPFSLLRSSARKAFDESVENFKRGSRSYSSNLFRSNHRIFQSVKII